MPKLKKLICKNNPLPFFDLTSWKNEWNKNKEKTVKKTILDYLNK